MKLGKSISELAEEIMRRESSKRDFLAPTDKLTMDAGANLMLPTKTGTEAFAATRHAHDQIGTYLSIPSAHYKRLQAQAPDLLANEFNRFMPQMMDKDRPQQRMVRTLDGQARAFLSNRYRRLDYFDMLQAILPTILSDSALVVQSCEVTDTKLYLKIVKPSQEAEIRKGDPTQAGFVITNSEIGMGAVDVKPFLYRLICLNGATIDEFGQRKNHVGRASESDASFELFSDKTLALDDAAFWAKVTDTVKGCLDEARVGMIFRKLKDATEMKITGNPETVVTELAKKFTLNEDQRSGILRNLIDGGAGLTAYGLANAVTALANTTESYDTASDLEKIGGKIYTLPASEWQALAMAA